MLKKKNALLTLSVSMALAACGGGGSSSGPVTQSSGKAVDGYIANATVVCDSDLSGNRSSADSVAFTNEKGDFSHTPGCEAPLFVTGGYSIDTGLPFRGTLKAPAGSSVVTPLTTLLADAGLTEAQLLNSLGLPAGTEIQNTDPGKVNADGSPANAELMRKTLVVQQIAQQAAYAIGRLAGDTSTFALQEIYSAVAKAIAGTLKDNPSAKLFSGGQGDISINSALLGNMVASAVQTVQASNDANLAVVKQAVAAIAPGSVSTLISPSIAFQSEQLLTASGNLTELTKSAQLDTTIGTAAVLLSPLLTTSASGKVDLAQIAEALKNVTIAAFDKSDSLNSAIASLEQATNTEARKPEINVALPPLAELASQNKFLYLAGDQVRVGSNAYSLSQFVSGVPLDSLTVSLNLVPNGTPIPLNLNGTRTITVSLGAEMMEADGAGRVLQVVVDKVILSQTGNQVTASVPDDAVLYAYGKTSSGATGNVRATDLASVVTSGTEGSVALHFDAVLNRIAGKAAGEKVDAFRNLLNTGGGVFAMKMVVSNVDMRKSDGEALATPLIKVTGTDQAFSGAGIVGVLTRR
jgi:hypothetical protein